MKNPSTLKYLYRIFGKWAVAKYKVLGMRGNYIAIQGMSGPEYVRRGDNMYATQREAEIALNALCLYRSHH